MESYNRSLIRYVSSKCHKFPRNFVSKILVLANRPIVISGCIAFMVNEIRLEHWEIIVLSFFQQEEKELTPEEAEFIQKIKSKMWVEVFDYSIFPIFPPFFLPFLFFLISIRTIFRVAVSLISIHAYRNLDKYNTIS